MRAVSCCHRSVAATSQCGTDAALLPYAASYSNHLTYTKLDCANYSPFLFCHKLPIVPGQGSVLIWDQTVAHGSSPNSSNR